MSSFLILDIDIGRGLPPIFSKKIRKSYKDYEKFTNFEITLIYNIYRLEKSVVRRKQNYKNSSLVKKVITK